MFFFRRFNGLRSLVGSQKSKFHSALHSFQGRCKLLASPNFPLHQATELRPSGSLISQLKHGNRAFKIISFTNTPLCPLCPLWLKNKTTP